MSESYPAETEPGSADGSYVENSTMVRLLGTPGKVKVISVFLGKHYTELSAARAAELAGIDVSTFHRNVDVMLDLGIIVESRTVGGTQLYRLDTDHPVAKALGKLRAELLEHVEDFRSDDQAEDADAGEMPTESDADGTTAGPDEPAGE